MVTKVQKWGNSQGVRISKDVLADAAIGIGDEVEILYVSGGIMILPVSPVTRGLSLDELLSRIPADYEAEEIDLGPPVGREVW